MRNSYGTQFIMAGSGNYYRTNEDNQLVVAATREEASIFTLFDANQRIGGGKKSTFYFTIPVEEKTMVEDKAREIKQLPEKMNCTEKGYNGFDIAHFDWIDYLWQFCYMASMVGNRNDELTKVLSEVDQEIIEETLIQIEDANYNVAQGYKAFKELKDLRNERKEKQRELQCLKAITEGINCVAMQEVYQNSVSAVEDIVHGNEKDETFALVSGGN